MINPEVQRLLGRLTWCVDPKQKKKTKTRNYDPDVKDKIIHGQVIEVISNKAVRFNPNTTQDSFIIHPSKLTLEFDERTRFI